MTIRHIGKVLAGIGAALPALALAAGLTDSLNTLVNSLANLIPNLIYIAFALAIIAFFYGIAKYVWSAGDATKASEGKNIMIYGAIAIAVMASVFGITR